VLMAEFMQEEASVMSEVYCETLKSCVQPLWTKCVECWHGSVVLLHDCAPPHTAVWLEYCWSISVWSCLTTLLTALTHSEQLPLVYLPEELVGITALLQ
jgi:hypothetical protein